MSVHMEYLQPLALFNARYAVVKWGRKPEPYVSDRGSTRGRWWVPTETDEGTSCLGVVFKWNSEHTAKTKVWHLVTSVSELTAELNFGKTGFKTPLMTTYKRLPVLPNGSDVHANFGTDVCICL